MDQKAIDIQKNIMQLVERQLGGRDYLLEWLRLHFGLAKASAYRRINGEVLLNLQELLLLIETFKLPTANLLEKNNDLFYFELNTNEPTTYIDWLEGMERRFEKLAALPNCKMFYSSNENPVFDFFHFDELTHFKLFIWAKTVWDFPDLQDQPFSLQSELWTKEASDTKNRILDIYQRVPSYEFWTPNILNNNINQIKYYLESYQFEDRYDALLLCDQLRSMLRKLQEQTRLGLKGREGVAGNGAKFTLYYNEMLHTNNTILFLFDGGKAMYSTFGNPNTIGTQQESACDYIEDWFGKLRQRCHRISSESERDRFRLFRQMEEKINKAEQLFKGMI